MMMPLVPSCAGTVRHLATRRRAASAAPRPTAAALIVTSRHRLWQRYGPDGIYAIEHAVGQLTAAMDRRGLAGTLVYADGSPLLTALGVLPAAPGEPDGVARVVRDVARRMVWTEEAARFVLLLGDDGIVPFHRLPNPTDDDDAVVLSDHAYGLDGTAGGDPMSLDPTTLGQRRSVGRLPDASLPALLAALAAATAAHDRLAAGAPLLLGDGAFWVLGVRLEARRARRVQRRRRAAPPAPLAAALLPGPAAPRPRRPALPLLQPPRPVRRPGLVRPGRSDVPGRLRRVPGRAAPGRHRPGAGRRRLRRGLPWGAGPSRRAGRGDGAGPPGRRLPGVRRGDRRGVRRARRRARGGGSPRAPLLARAPVRPARREALAVAKAALVAEGLARQRYLDAEDVKAIHNFVLYGDPSLVHAPSREAARMDGAGAAAEMFGPAATVGCCRSGHRMATSAPPRRMTRRARRRAPVRPVRAPASPSTA
ncbi:MAG: hypothetical protein U0470_07210 [Anaerolineae bacterium]